MSIAAAEAAPGPSTMDGRSEPSQRAGYTRVTTGALKHTIEAVTAQAFAVDTSDVSVTLADDAGHISVSVEVAIDVPGLREAVLRGVGLREREAGRLETGQAAASSRGTLFQGTQGTLFDRAAAARREILQRGQLLSGAAIRRVDIRLSKRRSHAGRTQ